MFDISWTEFLLIGIVALVVIGPKELPAVMRTMGQWTRKVRGMATEFQNQFQEAMREAEMADLKKQVDDMARDIKDVDPLKGVRDDIESAGKDVERSLASTPEQNAAPPPAVGEQALPEPPPAAEPAPEPAEAASASVAEASAPPPETVEKVEQADVTGRPG
jgi:sec-independent protein translocase protein TatB